MKTKEALFGKIISWLTIIAISLGKLFLKICIVVVLGAAFSFAIHYIKGYQLGSTMRVVGIVIAMLGLGSMTGSSGLRQDYNYNMAKMRDSKMLDNEHNGNMVSGSLSFLIWMGTSGILLFVVATYISI
jgi:hypothetical protein